MELRREDALEDVAEAMTTVNAVGIRKEPASESLAIVHK